MNRTTLATVGMVCGMLGVNSGAEAETLRTPVVRITLTNFDVTFSPPTVNAGPVTLVSTNDAEDVIHEIRLVKTNLPVDRLPLGPDGRVDEDSPNMTTIAAIEDLEPGMTSSVTLVLEPGRYVYFCNEEHHYMAGMRGEIIVQP